MTVTIGWVERGKVFKYAFSQNWLWSEFNSCRKVAQYEIQRGLESPDDSIDIIFDYTESGKYVPAIPKAHNEPPMGYAEDDPEPKQEKSGRKSRKNKKSKKVAYGHDTVMPHDSTPSPNVPDFILNEHEWIIPVGCLKIVGCSGKMPRIVTTMMKPAYEWDNIEIV